MRAHELIEFFTLAAAERDTRARPETRRVAAAHALALASDRSLGAETAWAAGRRTVALELSGEALDAALDALGALTGRAVLDAPGPLGDALTEVGLPRTDPGEILDAREPTTALAPVRDRDVHDRHARRHDDRQRAVRTLVNALGPRALPLPAVRRLRLVRALTAVASVLALTLGIGWLAAPEPHVEAVASAYRTDRGHYPGTAGATTEAWPPENSIDRDEMTYWQLPAGQTGWMELRLDPPRDVRAIEVMNGHDLHANDGNREDRRRFGYAAEDCVVTALAGDRAVAQARVTLPEVRDFEYETIPLEAHGVDTIRLQVNGYRGNGGGIAEIIVRERD